MKKILYLAMTSMVVLGLLVGCGQDKKDIAEAKTEEVTEELEEDEEEEEEENTEPQELTKVKVSEFRGINWASAYAAAELGYFEDEGLDVEFVIYKDGPIAFQGMHAGDSDFCLLSTEPVMRAYDEGLESALILTNTDTRGYAFASQGDIKTAADLKGKSVFAGLPGSAPYSFVLSILEEAGLSENDVSFINMEYSGAITALAEGTVDGIFYDVYNYSLIKEAVPDVNVLVDATVPEQHKELYGSEYCQTTIVTCTKEYVEENAETVQAFTNASVRALQWMDEHTPEEIAELLADWFEGIDHEELTAKFESVDDSYSSTGEILPEGYKTVEDFCVSQGLIEKEIGFENIVADEFVKNALEAIK